MLTMTHMRKDINATGRYKKKYDCIYCQRNHVKGIRNFPAYGQECFKCKRMNHFVTSKNFKGKHKEQDFNECMGYTFFLVLK